MDRAASPDGSGVERLAALLDEAKRLVDWLHERVAPPDGAAPPGESGFNGKVLLHTLKLMLARVLDDPSSLATHYAKFASVVLEAAQQKLDLEPDAGDRRFKDPLWRTSPLHRTLLQVYLGWQRTLGEWARAQHFTPADEQRVQFVLDQLVAALAPSNLPLNPAALKRAETTEGASAVNGIKQWVDDVLHRRAMPQQIRSDAFRVGEDLAITPGAVVHRHPLFELIEYASSTPTVHRKPLLMVPPQINKFYIFDLRPENSLFRYLVEQGFHLFCVSWRNPDTALRDAGLEDYVQATLQAIEVVRSISRTASIGVVSACAGGLTAISAMGLLAMRRERAVSHHSLLVTAPLAGNGSVLEAFASRETMLATADWSRQRGHMEGADLARLFAWLRPNDLVWNYWVNNYLMGRRPPSLDVLYWDNDSTRLPAALQRDFIDMVDRRVFERPGALTLAGTPIDFRKLRVDGYYVGGREDYLMPWQGVYRAARHFGTRRTFVLSTSGHVQSIVRPPNLGRTEYFSRDDLPSDPQEWFAGAESRKGSWWPHWAGWLSLRSGPRSKARRVLGNAAYAPIMPAPGAYVRES
jgi:polyhydroxyalkanoate synthase subunit PhaC